MAPDIHPVQVLESLQVQRVQNPRMGSPPKFAILFNSCGVRAATATPDSLQRMLICPGFAPTWGIITTSIAQLPLHSSPLYTVCQSGPNTLNRVIHIYIPEKLKESE